MLARAELIERLFCFKMKSEKEIQEAASHKAIEFGYPETSQAKDHFENGFRAAIKWMQEQDNWIEIKSINDLPKEECPCFIFDKPSQSIIIGTFLNEERSKKYWLKNASHYMRMNLPNPPKEK